MGIKYILSRLKKSNLFIESGKMFFAQGFGMFFAFLILIARSKIFSVDDVGLISYIASLVSLVSGFCNLGLDNTCARVIIQESDKRKKESLTGTSLFISLLLTELFAVVLYIISHLVPLLGKPEAKDFLLLILPFAGYNILLLTYSNVCYANGFINEAAIQLCISYVVYFIFLTTTQFAGILSLRLAIVSSYAINFLTVIIPILCFHRHSILPSLDAVKIIAREQKEKGWKIFLSRVIVSSSSNFDTLILGYFHPMDSVAYYSITSYLGMPISVLGTSVSQSTYRRYSNSDHIDKKMLKKVLLATIVMSLVISLVGLVSVLMLGENYYVMLKILPFSIISNAIASIGAIYNAFMNARGLAEELNKLSIITVIAKIVLDFVFVIPLGAIGGIIAALLANLIMLVLRIYYYNKFLAKTKSNN